MKILILILVTGVLKAVTGNYKTPDKEYAVVKVGPNEFFDDVDCSALKNVTFIFERELYYDGTPCEQVYYIVF